MARPLKILGGIVFFIISLFSLCFSQENITITTYYPSPYGSYRELRAQRMAIGENYSNSDYCWPPDTCTNQINANADLVVEGNVGIGTTTPQAKLEVNGNVKIVDGTQQAGYVLTSDANGVGSWMPKLDCYTIATTYWKGITLTCNPGYIAIGGGAQYNSNDTTPDLCSLPGTAADGHNLSSWYCAQSDPDEWALCRVRCCR